MPGAASSLPGPGVMQVVPTGQRTGRKTPAPQVLSVRMYGE